MVSDLIQNNAINRVRHYFEGDNLSLHRRSNLRTMIAFQSRLPELFESILLNPNYKLPGLTKIHYSKERKNPVIHTVLIDVQELETISNTLPKAIQSLCNNFAQSWERYILTGRYYDKVPVPYIDNQQYPNYLLNDYIVGHQSYGLETVGGHVPYASEDSLKNMYFTLPRRERYKAMWFSQKGFMESLLNLGEYNENNPLVTLFNRPLITTSLNTPQMSTYPVLYGNFEDGYYSAFNIEEAFYHLDVKGDMLALTLILYIDGAPIGPAYFKAMKVE